MIDGIILVVFVIGVLCLIFSDKAPRQGGGGHNPPPPPHDGIRPPPTPPSPIRKKHAENV